jgi:plasmid stability protein
MAKTIQIRNVPEDLHRELRLRATAAGMSLSDYCLERLALTGTRPSNAEVIKRAQDRAVDIPPGLVADIIRERRGD